MSVFTNYKLIARFSGSIFTKSPLRIGAGKGYGVLESDLPVIKDLNGVPIIPGSSLKGFFRGTLQRILSMKYSSGVESLLNEMFGGKDPGDWASPILFHEIKAKKYTISERKHISIDPEKGSVKVGPFDVECVMDGAIFEGTLFTSRNVSPKALALLKTVIDASNFEIAKLGGFKSRGYGSIEIKINRLEFILPGKSGEDLKKGIKVRGLIPNRKNSCLKLDSSEIKVNDKIVVDNVESTGKVHEVESFLGVKITFEGDEALKLLDGLIKVIG